MAARPIVRINTFFYLHCFSESRSSSGSTPSACPSATLLANSKSFNSFLFKLCKMIVDKLNMSTAYFMHISQIFSHFCEALNICFHRKCLGGVLFCLICNSQQFSFLYIITLPNDYSRIEDVHLLSQIFPHFAGVLNLDILSIQTA